MALLLIIKSIIVVLFLAMFLRRPNAVWGTGLLTVTSAVLLDTFLGTLGREQTIAELGFFFYILSGALFAGGGLWLWGLLRPYTSMSPTASAAARTDPVPIPNQPRLSSEQPARQNEDESPAFDRQMLYDEIRNRLGREDILDLIFDLGMSENDIISLNMDMNQLIIRLMDLAVARGQAGALTLAVERILTPLPPEILPRLERINAESPATVLRHYLLAHYDMAQLEQMTDTLGIDWEQLGIGSKKEMVRALLLHLYRRSRISELINLMHQGAGLPSIGDSQAG